MTIALETLPRGTPANESTAYAAADFTRFLGRDPAEILCAECKTALVSCRRGFCSECSRAVTRRAREKTAAMSKEGWDE